MCLDPEKHPAPAERFPQPWPSPLRAGQLFLSPSPAASIPSAVLQETLFLKFPQPAWFLSGHLQWCGCHLSGRGFHGGPYTCQYPCGRLPFSLSTMLCSGASLCSSSISSILFPEPHSNLLINHHTSPLFVLASCHLEFDKQMDWKEPSEDRGFERWLEGGLGSRGFLIMVSPPVLSPDIRGSLVTCWGACHVFAGSLRTCSGSQLSEAVRTRPVLGTERAVAEVFLPAIA